MTELPILTIIATDQGVCEVDVSCAGTRIDSVRLHARILPVVGAINDLIRQMRAESERQCRATRSASVSIRCAGEPRSSRMKWMMRS